MRALLSKSKGAAIARWRRVRAAPEDALPPAFADLVAKFPEGSKVRALRG